MDHLTMAQEKEFDSPFGKLTCKTPSIKKQMEIARRQQMYAGGLPLASNDWDLAEAMAILDTLIINPPTEFQKDKETGNWDYDRLHDIDALIDLGKAVKEWVNSFRRGVREEQA